MGGGGGEGGGEGGEWGRGGGALGPRPLGHRASGFIIFRLLFVGSYCACEGRTGIRVFAQGLWL